MAMMAMTTSSSMSVKPEEFLRDIFTMFNGFESWRIYADNRTGRKAQKGILADALLFGFIKSL